MIHNMINKINNNTEINIKNRDTRSMYQNKIGNNNKSKKVKMLIHQKLNHSLAKKDNKNNPIRKDKRVTEEAEEEEEVIIKEMTINIRKGNMRRSSNNNQSIRKGSMSIGTSSQNNIKTNHLKQKIQENKKNNLRRLKKNLKLLHQLQT